MSFLISWDDSFESIPDDQSWGYDLDEFIQNIKIAVRERAELEHVWKVGTTDGQHIPGKTRVLYVGTESDILSFYGYEGAIAYATDTKRLYRCSSDGANWTVISLDHGSVLDGLSDDDHTIYLLADGSRALSGDLDLNSNKIINLADPTNDNDGANKKYIDNQLSNITPAVYGSSSTSSMSVPASWTTLLEVDVDVESENDKFFMSAYVYAESSSLVDFQIRLYDNTTSSVLCTGNCHYIQYGNCLNLSFYKTGLSVETHTIKFQGYGASGVTAYDRSLAIWRKLG